MPDQPLQPFGPPVSLLHYVPGGTVTPGGLTMWFLFAVFAFWTVYTLVAIYHWLRYSHASLIAFPAIALHLFVSFILITFALSGALPSYLL